MEFIIENFEYIALLLLIATVVILIFVLVYVLHVSNYFSNRKFRILGRYEYEPSTLIKEFVIQVFNNNVNDSRIVGFGFIYKEQTIDYFKTYSKLKELDPSKQLIVLSRDSFELHVSSRELETIISDYNKGRKHVSMIWVYAIDYQGIVTKSKSRSIRRVVSMSIQNAFGQQKKIEKETRNNQRKEERNDRQNRRKLAQLNRREIFNKWWLIVKTKFKKKPKNAKQ
jgi:hypothetical protein